MQKRRLGIYLRLAVFSALLLHPCAYAASIPGDVNTDGRLDVFDLLEMVKVTVVRPGSASPEEISTLDLSGDSLADISDLLALFWLLSGSPRIGFSDVLAGNHTGTAFVVSWRTDSLTSGNLVRYGYDPNGLFQTALDTTNADRPNHLHFVQLTWLDPDKTVYYRLRSGNSDFSLSPGGVDSVRTYPQVMPVSMVNLGGLVTDWQGKPPERVLVRSFLKSQRFVGAAARTDSSLWFSVLANSSGGFALNVANYRTGSGIPAYYQPGQTWLHLDILAENGQTCRDSVLLTAQEAGYQVLGTFRLSGE